MKQERHTRSCLSGLGHVSTLEYVHVCHLTRVTISLHYTLYLEGSTTLLAPQLLHTTRPHRLQWCRRTSSLNTHVSTCVNITRHMSTLLDMCQHYWTRVNITRVCTHPNSTWQLMQAATVLLGSITGANSRHAARPDLSSSLAVH